MNIRPALLPLAVALMLAGCDSSDPVSGAIVPPPAGACARTSWIAGTSELCGGRLIYRDYVYDDYGADDGSRTTPIAKGPLSPSAGDLSYPVGAENTADLVRLELWLEGSEVVVEFELNTLYTADQTIAVLAIDTDNNAATGGGDWPDLGVASAGWDQLHRFTAGNPDTNRIGGRFPKPAGSDWTLWAAVAQANGTVMNVAFRGPDEEALADASANAADSARGTFWEDKQALALADGDITAFAQPVHVADLTGGVTRAATVGPGLHQRVYTSAYTLPPGEGISADGVPGRHGDTGYPCEQYFHYLGKYQPYGIYIPDQPGTPGLQFLMHGCSANHASLINQPGMQQQFGEELNRILVVPLGRGPDGFYSDISERDVLDVLLDVAANYPIDETQIVSGGYSMGGYGAMRFAAFYPQLFATATNWVGFTGNVSNTPTPAPTVPADSGAIGNVIDFIQNLRNIPIVNLYAGADELVQVSTALAMQERFGGTEVVHEFYLHPNAEHLTFAVLDDWTKEAAYSAGRRRVDNPAHVTYRTDASLDYPEYAIRHDRAYWVSGIVGRGEGYIDVDIKSLACGHAAPVFSNGTDGGFGPAPLTWTRQFREVSGTTPAPAVNRIEATLANVASLAIDTAGACLARAPIDYRIVTDGPVTLALSDGRRIVLAAAGTHEATLP